MKRIYTILAAVLVTATLWAQSPQKMSYQAVIRDASNQLAPNTSAGMQISILQGSATGTAVYVETQIPTTNINGLVTIEIGTGTVVSGDFTTIDWANDNYFIKTETDINGGSNYTITGTSQILSVPYALHAKTAESIVGGITETDPVYTNSQAANITATNITSLNNLSGTNTGNQNLDDVLTQNNSAGNKNITNLANPVNAQDAATKAYVDALEERIDLLKGVTDYDGNKYEVVKIGNQIWMAENLKVTHYPNGDPIPLVTDKTAWSNLADNNTDDAYSYYNNNTSGEANTYGALYTYAAAIGDNWAEDNKANQGVCPDGWHLSSDTEWSTLTSYLGGASVAGGKMKEIGTAHWDSPNTGADNSSGFLALPSGYRSNTDGTFGNVGNIGYWWSSTESNSSGAYYSNMYYSNTNVNSYSNNKSYGFSVRCVRD